MTEYAIFLHALAHQRKPEKKRNLAQRYSLRDEDDARTSNTRMAQRKRAIAHSAMKHNRNMKCVLVTTLCNQPEACASDLGDGSHVSC